MLNNKESLGVGSVYPWGISHKTYVQKLDTQLNGRFPYLITTQYYFRLRLPKYVSRMFRHDLITADKLREIFTEFAAQFNGIHGNTQFVAVQGLLAQESPEILVKMIVNDERYDRSAVSILTERTKRILRVVMAYLKTKLVRHITENNGFIIPEKQGKYILDEAGCIRYIRSP